MRVILLFLTAIIYIVASNIKEPLEVVDITPSSNKIRALYLNRYAAKPSNIAFKRALKIAKTTPINAFVIDIKDVQGYLTYKSSIPEVIATGANRKSTIKDMKRYISYLKKQGIYTIARIAVFKDNKQALKYPSRAIKRYDGRVWLERGGARWIDPGNKAGQEYTLKIAKEVASFGFDEINFDYIRFPARKGLHYQNGNTKQSRVKDIEAFLSQANSTLRAYGVKISADIFGYVLWNRDDLHIGQMLENISTYVDYICPMLYPSGYYRGTLGLKNPSAHPYKIVKSSLEKVANRIPHSKFRPWLQSFRDYAFDKRAYTHKAIAAQIAAVNDYGTSGWMLWNPNSRYSYVDKRLFKMVSNYKYTKAPIRYKRAKHRVYKEPIISNPTPTNSSPLDILKE